MELKLHEIYHAYMYSYPHKTAYRELKDINIKDYYHFLEERKDNSLYIHIPFCEIKCGYCNLFSLAGGDKSYYKQYVNAVLVHIKQSGLKNISFQNFIMGGGTPLILSETLLEQLFNAVESIGVSHKTVYTAIETSPKQTTEEKLRLLKDFSVNRISIGIQSFVTEELKIINRSHDVKSINKALEQIKKADFDSLNIDLIYGIPGQTLDSLKYSIEQALSYEPEELFIYPLYIRSNTPMQGYERNEKTYEMYWLLREYLLSNGYIQTSMRRFAKKTGESASCGFENTISFGCGGRSYLSNLHFCTKYSGVQKKCKEEIEHYINMEDKTKVTHGIIIDKEEQKRRYVIKNLLHMTGIDLQEFYDLFDSELFLSFPIIKHLLTLGYVKVEEENKSGKVKLTKIGMSLSDYIGPMFISDSISDKMQAYFE